MKIRTDFVSNSSSTSFVIHTNGIDTSKLDGKFFKLISRCKYLYFYFPDGVSSDLVDELKSTIGNSKVSVYDDSIEIELNKTVLLDDVVSVLLKTTQTAEDVSCSYGCDDCGEYICEATQVCTLIEMLYGIVPKGDDHFYYTPISKLGLDS